jgi:Fe-S cluster assembly protein SufD
VNNAPLLKEEGFPTIHLEDWRYTNLRPLLQKNVQAAQKGIINSSVLSEFDFPVRLIFNNGYFEESLSRTGSSGVTLESRSLVGKQPLVAKSDWLESRYFAKLNNAEAKDGAVCVIKRGNRVKEPIHLVYFNTAPNTSVEKYCGYNVQNWIVLEEGSSAIVYEHYLSLGAGTFTNHLTVVKLASGSRLEHGKIKRGAETTVHLDQTETTMESNATYVSNLFTFGEGLTRNEMRVLLNGEGSECELNGLFLATKTGHIDNYTWIDHAKPNCKSNELYKGILGGASLGVFSGKIIVRPDAQKTNATQSNRNLLLSDEATINSKPQLEIYADDVKCSHGATTGQLDEEAVFYLRTRGISEESARQMLTLSFAAEVALKVSDPSVRQTIQDVIGEKLC